MREIALHILDICQNSVTAKATEISVTITADETADRLEIVIGDNGCGMSAELLNRVTSPFTTTRTTRKVGLGIPLFKAGCEACGGSFNISSELGKGTVVTAKYMLGHIDRPPMGELAETLHSLITANPETDFVIRCTFNDETFELDTKVIKATLQGVPVNTNDVSIWLLEYLQEGLNELFGGKHI